MTETQTQHRYRVQGLDCPDCAASFEKAVDALPRVQYARLAYTTSELTVVPVGDDDTTTDEIAHLARSMGYRLAPVDEETAEEPVRWWQRNRSALDAAIAGFFALAGFVASLLGAPIWLTNGLYAIGIVGGGLQMARAGWTALRKAHSVDMNTLMSIAALGAMIVGEFAEGALTVFLFAIGEMLEDYSSDRARDAVKALMELAPEEANLVVGDQIRTVPTASLHIGDWVSIRPGERIPIDAEVVSGRSAVDEAAVTGESIPVEKESGEELLAGTMNGSGALVAAVTRLAADSTISRIRALVEEAQASRAPSQRFVDRFAGVYTPLVVGIASLVAIVPPLLGLGTLGEWGYRALVMLVIACPCALVISTPVTVVSGLARAAKAGALIKGGEHLEALATLKVVAFDKTGTITRGEPRIVSSHCAYHPQEGEVCTTCQDLLAKAASIEARSEHALARAVLHEASANGLSERYPLGEDVVAKAGEGIAGTVQGHRVWVGSGSRRVADGAGDVALSDVIAAAEESGQTVLVVDDACCNQSCVFAVEDSVRDGAPEAIERLKSIGIEHVAMLTGDNEGSAKRVAEQAGIDYVRARLLPGEKASAIRDIQERYGPVAMVGDGINDAPALAQATVGIAMGVAGTDVALETADVALMGDDLSQLPFVIGLSRHTRNLVRTNIAFALVFKALFLGLAAAGMATLWMAVVADTGASLAVTLNGLRALRYERRRSQT